MGKQDEKEWLTAAECASRTGLTIRALRVYEREGLINPSRSAKGWRRYGPADLTRLNTIAILKTLGMPLARIGALFAENPPSLAHALQIQADAWKARRTAADHALTLVETALARLQSNQVLSIDELCGLVRSFETGARQSTAREVIDEYIGADEQLAWIRWWAEHPLDLAENRAFVQSQNLLFAELGRLMSGGLQASSREVQAIIARHNELLARHGVRERAVRQLDWNSAVTHKWYGVGTRMREARARWSSASSGAPVILSTDVAKFFIAAQRHSPWAKVIYMIVDVARELAADDAGTSSPQAQHLADQFRAACSNHSLGDPLVYTRWLPFLMRVNGGIVSDHAWTFLAQALQAARTD